MTAPLLHSPGRCRRAAARPRRWLPLVLLLCLCAPLARAQDAPRPAPQDTLQDGPPPRVAVRSHVSVDSVRVGDRFVLSLVAEHPFDAPPSFPEAAGDSARFGDLEVLGRSERAVHHRNGLRVDSVAYEVTTFALDTAYVPPLPVRFGEGGDTLSAAAAGREVPVISLVPPDAEEIQDLAPLVGFPASLWPWVLVAAIAAAVAAALFYVWWRRRRARGEAEPGEPEPVLSAYEEALERLRALEHADLSGADALKPYYVELSELLRTYLARRLHVNAMEQTTRELAAALQGVRRLPEEARRQIRDVLEQCDLVKFADAQPPTERSREVRDETYEALNRVERALYQPAEDAPRMATAAS